MPIFSAGSASVSIVPDFKGAQKAIGEWFASQGDLHVGVNPDLNQADLLRIRAELGALSGTAEIKVDKNKFSTDLATAMSDAFKGATGLFDFGLLLDKTIKPALIVGAAGLATELASALSTAIEGSLALLPAAILGLAAPLAAVKIGITGISAAFKDLTSGNMAQFQQDLAKLAPSAQAFVTQVHALAPAWTALKLDVQQNLFAGLGAEITKLGNVALPVMRTGLAGIATSLNEGLVATMERLTKDGGAFTTLFANINTAVHTIATGALPVMVQDFVQMGVVGSQFLPQLATGFTNLVGKFDTWFQHALQTGQFVEMIKQALSILSQLGTLLGNLAGVIGDIFRAALPFGVEFLGLLNQLTGGLKLLLATTNAQNGLKTFFGDITNAVKVILPALQQLIAVLLVNVLPVIGEFLQALAPVAALLGTQLANALRTVSGLFPPLAQVVAGLIGAFAPLISVMGQLVTTILPPLLQVGHELIPVISALTTAFGAALLQAVKAVAPFIKPLGDAFVQILSAITPLLPSLGHLAQQVLPPLLTAVTGLVNLLVPILVPILKTLAQHADLVVAALGAWFAAQLILDAVVAFQSVGGIAGIAIRLIAWADSIGVIKVATALWTAAQWLLNVAMDANPIGLVILAIAALVTAVILIVTHLQFFKGVWNDVWSFIKSATQSVVDFFTQTFVPFFTQTIPHFWENAWTTVRDFFVGIWNDIASWVQIHIINWFTGTFVNFFTQTIPHAFESAWNGIRDFFKGLWTDLVSWFETALGKFGGFFTKFWGDLSDGVGKVWHAILRALEVPVQTVINWVWNDTLRPAWNLLNNLWGGTDLGPVTLPGLSAAAGGVLPGWSPGSDIHHFYSPTAGWLNLSGGEAILRPEVTAALGADWVNGVNAAAISGGSTAVASRLGFAGGGIWPNPDWAGHVALGDRSLNWAGSLLSGLPSWLTSLIVPGGDVLKPLTDYILQETKASKDQGGSNWFDVLGGITRNGLNQMWAVIKSSVLSVINSTVGAHPFASGPGGGGSFAAGPPASRSANVAAVQQVAAQYHWDTGTEWTDLVNLIMRESGFNNVAQNPTSTAYGMFQFLDSTWGSFGIPKTSDPHLQAVAGLAYIGSRYGDPIHAWAHETSAGWYDQGGWLPPGWSTVYNGTGQHELVLNPQQQSSIGQRLANATGGALVNGGINIAMQTANPYEVADELVYRLRVASRGGVYSTVRG